MKKWFKNTIKSKIIIWILLVLGIISVLYIFIDWRNLYVDIYNFQQLKKAIPILENIPVNEKKFYWLKEFNKKIITVIKFISFFIVLYILFISLTTSTEFANGLPMNFKR